MTMGAKARTNTGSNRKCFNQVPVDPATRSRRDASVINGAMLTFLQSPAQLIRVSSARGLPLTAGWNPTADYLK
jgi:hypothetical protein